MSSAAGSVEWVHLTGDERVLWAGTPSTYPALPAVAVGFVVSFLAAWACVRWLLRYVSSHTFVPVAWYRIAFGVIVLATWVTGTVVWAD